jgi:5-methylcytosine-specific restriction endonuclease McrA
MEPALLLNSTYEPLKVISWQKAITLVVLGKADVLEHQRFSVRSQHEEFVLPSVLRLTRRVRIPRKPVQFSRANIYRRDGFQCQYCGQRFAPGLLTFDHVIPRSRGGDTSWLNIVASCQSCNRIKADRTPEEAGLQLLNSPREPQWWPFTASGFGNDPHPEQWRSYLWL